MDYFEINYIGELRRGRRLEPRYSHTLWNMNLRVHKNLPRTNNNLEGWYNRFSNPFAHRLTHVSKFIDGLKQDSSLNHLLMAQMIVHRTRHNNAFTEKLMNVFKGWWLVTKTMTSSAYLEEYLTICHTGHHEITHETV